METELFFVQVRLEDLAVSTGSQRMVLERRTACFSQTGLFPWSFSRDGKTLALYEVSLAPLGSDIGILSMEGKREIKELLHEKNFEVEPQISPDGRYMAYQSDESGKGESMYVHS